ncbi:MAG: CBS domain-containing protein [Methanobacteriota archaeon]
MITAQDILDEDVVKIDGNELFSKVLSLFKETDAIVITEGDLYKGMLLKRCLMEPKLSLETKVHTMLTHAPKLHPTTPIEEIARLMIENGIYHLPVLEDDSIVGIVTADEVVRRLTEQTIASQAVKTIMCTQPRSISPEENLGKVINMFQQQDIPYLAVLDHTKLVGAITMDEIIEHVIHPESRIGGTPGHGDYATEKKKTLDLQVKSIMQEEPLVMSPEATVREVHTRMHKFELPGVLIGKESNLHGVVTHRELLAPFVDLSKQETIELLFHHNTKKVDGFDKVQAAHFLYEDFLKHYDKFLDLGSLHISLEQHKEVKQGIHRVVCEMKLSSKRGIFYATHEGWGPMQAMKNTTDAIQHQLRKAKDA